MGSPTNRDTIASKNSIGIAVVGRRVRRGREKRLKHDFPGARPFAEALPPVVPAADPVRIAVLAVDRLAPASLRASFTGKEVRVTVPDATTAAIFEAAISETGRTRSTDRLIRIVVD